MTTARKLRLGFGILAAITALFGLALVLRMGSIEGDISELPNAALALLMSGVFVASITGALLSGALVATENAVREDRASALASAGRKAAIIQASLDCIIEIDHESCIVEFNPAAERTFGYRREDVLGRGMAELIIPRTLRKGHRQGMARYLATGEGPILGQRIQISAMRSNGAEFPVELTVLRVPVEGPPAFAAVLRDLTAQRQAESHLRESDRRKDEFLAMLAHELRNPLAPIRSGLHLIRLKKDDAESVDTVVAMMERQVVHLVRLVDDLLDVSRISQGKIELRRERVELGAVAKEAVGAARAMPQCARREILLELPPDPVWLDADATRLAQILGNLLNNACKFTGEDGRILLAVEHKGGEATIRVKDDGIGISADNLQRVFDMFVQADSSMGRETGGLGIGLTLVRTLVELHGGSVQAGSGGVGHGTEILVRLPVRVTE